MFSGSSIENSYRIPTGVICILFQVASCGPLMGCEISDGETGYNQLTVGKSCPIGFKRSVKTQSPKPQIHPNLEPLLLFCRLNKKQLLFAAHTCLSCPPEYRYCACGGRIKTPVPGMPNRTWLFDVVTRYQQAQRIRSALDPC